MSDIMPVLSRAARSPGVKVFVIFMLIVMLLVPLFIVGALVAERTGRAAEVQREVASTWGGVQQISGPYLVVPYLVTVQIRDGEKWIDQVSERRAIISPEDLSITGTAQSKVLHRSIFDVNVYTAGLKISGRFGAVDLGDVDTNITQVRWRDAVLVAAISDVSGLKEASTVTLNGATPVPFAPSLGMPNVSMNGIHAKLASLAGENGLQAFSFEADLVFTGSDTLTFAPAARETKVQIKADWPHPNFMGAFLPVERTISDQGFSAAWRVPHLARSVPASWRLMDAGLERMNPHLFGVSFYSPVDFYDTVTRAVKYGILFLSAAFMGVFLLEMLSGKHVHAVQYVFVGISMIFFYVLLLSFAEHIGFKLAYGVAAGATGGMLSLYVGKALKSLRSGVVMLALFLVLYAFLYLVLQLEDYALLAGAIMGFIGLTTIMFATLRVDWSGGEIDTPSA